MRIPEHGLARQELFELLERHRADDMPWRTGRTWAYVYDPGPEAESVIKDAFTAYLSENGLDPTVFPSALRLENEVVSMAAAHLHADGDVAGSFTSGGTESIMLAVKAARDRARELRPDIDRPEVVLPETAHAAFQKACHYLGLHPVLVPVDPVSFRADPDAVAAAVTDSTVLLVGSAISYAHGVVDPIEELGRLALERDLWLHVDGCMGGFLLQYVARLGRPVPAYDFRVPGVSSISMDLHKYAFAAKGASTVLYRTKDLRRHQMYACSNWTGYTVINPTIQSTKSAGPVAAAWAALQFIGDDGYLAWTRQVLAATDRIVAHLDAHPDLRLLGRPDMNLLSFAADGLSVFHVVDEMRERDWYVQPQLAFGSSPENIHLSINPASVRWVDEMLADLDASVVSARDLPSGELAAAIDAEFGGIDPDTVSGETIEAMLALAGASGDALPERMAPVNEVLNALPVPLRERLLVLYLNDLFRQSP
ncbi:MAG: aspartate aminotransferase family protein [Acidimicrobiales bacterium]|jgi:glutamate/tyrosine decarboxylase-like PLP-dependent enzyme|nr:aspartate aminotransferase family protein [Acidimicrobiales bacterium]